MVNNADLITKNYKLSNRSLLHINSNNTIFETPFALNEISVCSKENTSMINIQVFLNDKYLEDINETNELYDVLQSFINKGTFSLLYLPYLPK